MRNVKKEMLILVLLTFLVSGCGFLRIPVYRNEALSYAFEDFTRKSEFDISYYDKPGYSLPYLENKVMIKASEAAIANGYTHFLVLNKELIKRKSGTFECHGPLLDPITPCKVNIYSYAKLRIKCFKSAYPKDAIEAQQFLNATSLNKK